MPTPSLEGEYNNKKKKSIFCAKGGVVPTHNKNSNFCAKGFIVVHNRVSLNNEEKEASSSEG